MKRKLVLLSVAVLILSFLFALPVSAYNGASGKVIDSKTGDGWTHGGNVYIYCDPGTGMQVCGSGTLDGSGNFNVAYTTQPTLLSEVTVVFDLTASPPWPAPSVDPVKYDEYDPPTGRKSVGNVETGTGPNAITLAGFDAGLPSSGVTFAGLALLSLAVLAGAVGYLHSRENA